MDRLIHRVTDNGLRPGEATMIVQVFSAGNGGALVRLSEYPDGVNPPNVIELVVGKPAKPRGVPPEFKIQLRAGSVLDGDDDEVDAETLFEYRWAGA